MIRSTLAKTTKYKLNVKPSCAPQFMRVAKDQGVDMSRWVRGCMAGLYYCRIYPSGEVTPCPYMPVSLGNIREKSFKDIWFNSEVFKALRDFDQLKGKCGVCEHRDVCGGCRARAYGVTTEQMDFCGACMNQQKCRVITWQKIHGAFINRRVSLVRKERITVASIGQNLFFLHCNNGVV